MSLKIGIIGLPNVGKSTTFNALTRTQNAEVANYPFCTIEPNQAVVPVPDDRVHKLAELVNVNNAVPATIEFLDIAGLVKGASRGEGLGNQFLAQIRNTDALLHVVRCFDDPNVVHVRAEPEPQLDIETIEVELTLADLEQIQNKVSKLERQVKGDRSLLQVLETARAIQEHLGNLNPYSSFPDRGTEPAAALHKELQFLTGKPVIYGANLSEAELAGGNQYLQKVEELAVEKEIPVVRYSATLEAELATLSDQEAREYLDMAGVTESGLEQLIRTGYRTLSLISFFTYNDREARAWTVREGTSAPRAAGTIHTDFEKGFIKAEVIPFSLFEELGSTAAAKEAGKLRLEGKNYIVQDGDVIYFRFNV